MKKVTRWSPDTCGCVLDYEWDDTEPESSRTISQKAVVYKCAVHLAIPEQAILNTVLDENQRKNFTFGEVQKNDPDAKIDDYEWSFDSKRILTIHLNKVNVLANNKEQLQKGLDNKFGSGKVKVE